MNKKIRPTLKRVFGQRTALLLIITVIICSIIAVYGRYGNGEKSMPTASCPSSNSGVLVPLSFSEMSEESPAIVSAKLEGETQSGYAFKIIDNLKGSYFSQGQTIDVCVNLTTPEKDMSYEPTLLLLKGWDKKKNQWSTVQDYMGVFSSTSEDRFKISNDAKEAITLEEAKRQLAY